MNINLFIIYFSFYRKGFWFRLWTNNGLIFKNKSYPVLFSERMGYEKPFRIFGWRINRLKP